MKIVYLAAGAAGMYCGSCLHDNTLAAALMALGDDVLLVPTYTPLRTDEANVSQRRVFLGGINVYLQDKLALFRHTPQWLDRMLDSPWLLNIVTRRAVSTDPAALGGLTESVLRGEAGRQAKELEKLVAWLADDVRPDVVHLSNALLLGLARAIKARLRVPIVCSLSGEDIFIERLTPPHDERVRHLLVERAADADGFVALNRYYASAMTDYLKVAPERVHVIPHGLDLRGHAPSAQQPAALTPSPRSPLTIGYFARICHAKGLHVLVEAFIRLARSPDFPPGSLNLKFGGYLGTADHAYLAGLKSQLDAAGLSAHYEHVGELDRSAKIALLQSLDVFCLPTVYRESKGLSLLEAWANGIPAVVPRHGAFPELVADTQGGLLFEPEDVASLVASLALLVRDPNLRQTLGTAAQTAIQSRYRADQMARATHQLYERLTS